MSTDRKGWREILGSRAKFVAAGIAGALRGLTPAVNARGLGGDRPQPVSVAEVMVADLPIWVSALGTVCRAT
ncbi:MAG: hypothetical protein WBO95_07155 [Candidatus Dechloromonas phosphoritropha]|jgi:multidrug efflux pump subunit AcrA (membrane-fusion protein)